MRKCPQCQHDNPSHAMTCQQCKKALPEDDSTQPHLDQQYIQNAIERATSSLPPLLGFDDLALPTGSPFASEPTTPLTLTDDDEVIESLNVLDEVPSSLDDLDEVPDDDAPKTVIYTSPFFNAEADDDDDDSPTAVPLKTSPTPAPIQTPTLSPPSVAPHKTPPISPPPSSPLKAPSLSPPSFSGPKEPSPFAPSTSALKTPSLAPPPSLSPTKPDASKPPPATVKSPSLTPPSPTRASSPFGKSAPTLLSPSIEESAEVPTSPSLDAVSLEPPSPSAPLSSAVSSSARSAAFSSTAPPATQASAALVEEASGARSLKDEPGALPDAEPLIPDEEWTPPPDPLIGIQLGNFRILEKIGQGGFGSVYRAEQIHLEQSFAIKVLKTGQRANPETVERFRREAKALARLRHENIVQLSDFGTLPDHGFYLVMEFLEGKSLSQAIKDHEDFPLERIKSIMQQTCSVLHYMHEMGVLHRDLKPANILLAQDKVRDERIKLIDFGIAAIAEEDVEITKEGAYLGSPLYMSPEQGRNLDVDRRSDLYALGITLFQLLTGKPPFMGSNFASLLSKHLFTPPPTLQEVLSERQWSPVLEQFIQRILSKEPDERPQDASLFWEECAHALAHQEQHTSQWGALPAQNLSQWGTSSNSANNKLENTPLPAQHQVSEEASLMDSLELTQMENSAPEAPAPPMPPDAPLPPMPPATPPLPTSLPSGPAPFPPPAPPAPTLSRDTAFDGVSSLSKTDTALDSLSPFAVDSSGPLEASLDSLLDEKYAEPITTPNKHFILFGVIGFVCVALLAYLLWPSSKPPPVARRPIPRPPQIAQKRPLPRLPAVLPARKVVKKAAPKPSPIELKLDSNPSGALIFSEGKAIGTTPHTIVGDPGEKGEYILKHKGYKHHTFRWQLGKKNSAQTLKLLKIRITPTVRRDIYGIDP